MRIYRVCDITHSSHFNCAFEWGISNPVEHHGKADHDEEQWPEWECRRLDPAEFAGDLEEPPYQQEQAHRKTKAKPAFPAPPSVLPVHLHVLFLHAYRLFCWKLPFIP